MVIDRPHFYFEGNKIKRWLAITALVSFICSLVTCLVSIKAATVLMFVAIMAVVIYVVLWFVT